MFSSLFCFLHSIMKCLKDIQEIRRLQENRQLTHNLCGCAFYSYFDLLDMGNHYIIYLYLNGQVLEFFWTSVPEQHFCTKNLKRNFGERICGKTLLTAQSASRHFPGMQRVISFICFLSDLFKQINVETAWVHCCLY